MERLGRSDRWSRMHVSTYLYEADIKWSRGWPTMTLGDKCSLAPGFVSGVLLEVSYAHSFTRDLWRRSHYDGRVLVTPLSDRQSLQYLHLALHRKGL